ncbi:hypothetical protein GOV11_01910 [Candidatus Woesearchaeota archaeon]|nr:hypothetical protein [Candidatus Woesearchaeota archaeon]
MAPQGLEDIVQSATGMMILVNKLEGPFAPKVIPYGDFDFVATPSDSSPEGHHEKEYKNYEKLLETIEEEFSPDRGCEIVSALREAVINFEEHRNKFDKELLVKLWPWRSTAHLCFAINADGKPSYDFDPRGVRMSAFELDGSVYQGHRKRGHIIMSEYADFLAYDKESKDEPFTSMYIYFNLPKEHWLT